MHAESSGFAYISLGNNSPNPPNHSPTSSLRDTELGKRARCFPHWESISAAAGSSSPIRATFGAATTKTRPSRLSASRLSPTPWSSSTRSTSKTSSTPSEAKDAPSPRKPPPTSHRRCSITSTPTAATPSTSSENCNALATAPSAPPARPLNNGNGSVAQETPPPARRRTAWPAPYQARGPGTAWRKSAPDCRGRKGVPRPAKVANISSPDQIGGLNGQRPRRYRTSRWIPDFTGGVWGAWGSETRSGRGLGLSGEQRGAGRRGVRCDGMVGAGMDPLAVLVH